MISRIKSPFRLLAALFVFAAWMTGNAGEPDSVKYVFLFIGDGMSYPQFQAASDYLGAVADTAYANALPSTEYDA